MLTPRAIPADQPSDPPSAPLEEGGGRAGGLSLVYKGQSSTQKKKHNEFKEWNRHQKRVYSRLKSFTVHLMADGYRLRRVDLTTAVGGDAKNMAKHSKELFRRIERVFECEVIPFQVKTKEGQGVIHCMIGVKSKVGKVSVYIPQDWLSNEWEKIHGASIVWIKAVNTKHHAKNCVRYISEQYLAGQDMLDRMFYAWDKLKISLGRGWAQIKKIAIERSPVLWHEKRFGRMYAVRDLIPMRDVINAWQALLEVGWCHLSGEVYVIEDRQVMPKFYIGRSFYAPLPEIEPEWI